MVECRPSSAGVICGGYAGKGSPEKKKKMGLRLQVRKLPSVMVQLSVYKRTQLLKWNEYSERFAYPFCQFLNDL